MRNECQFFGRAGGAGVAHLSECYRTERLVLGDEAILYIFKEVGKFEELAHGS
jgi:hypothetical protein